MGDFNDSVGCQNPPPNTSMGKFWLGINERGTNLLEFCEENEFVISNTFFEVPMRRKYTWRVPGDINRYQIDYILVKKKYRNQIKSSHSYPSFDVDSDHNLIIMNSDIKFKRRQIQQKKRWCLERLKKSETCTRFQTTLDMLVNNDDGNIWDGFKNKIKMTADKILGKNVLVLRKPWMNQSILNLIKKRNMLRKYNYNRIQKI